MTVVPHMSFFFWRPGRFIDGDFERFASLKSVNLKRFENFSVRGRQAPGAKRPEIVTVLVSLPVVARGTDLGALGSFLESSEHSPHGAFAAIPHQSFFRREVAAASGASHLRDESENVQASGHANAVNSCAQSGMYSIENRQVG